MTVSDQLQTSVGDIRIYRKAVVEQRFQVKSDSKFEKLLTLLEKLPAIDLASGRKSIDFGTSEGGTWWTKFSLDTEHPLAWRHVQELGHVLNYISVDERLPTVFVPVSPPSYGVEFLSWVIESTDPNFTPDDCVEYLAGRLPLPVDDPNQWELD